MNIPSAEMPGVLHFHHHEHAIDASSLNTAFKLGIALNVGFVYDRERHDGACCH